jgi:hypothetical protein
MGGAGLSAGASDDGGGVSLVACTLSDNDVLAKSGDVGVIGVGLRVGVGATTAVVGCDILTQGLIGLIEYSYHQGVPYFLESHLQGTPGLSVLGSEQFQNGLLIGKFSRVCTSEDKSAQKRLGLVCGASL